MLERPPSRPAPHRSDHCGMMFGEMNPWDWPGRPDGIWLHPRCEAAWLDGDPDASAWTTPTIEKQASG